jgi:hypothetical protein
MNIKNEVTIVKIICVHISLFEKRNCLVTKYRTQKANRIIDGTQTKKASGNTKYVSCK